MTTKSNRLPSPKPTPLPFVYLNLAMTADGKIAFANRRFVPFSSRRDRELLLQLRVTADAVMAGARTVDRFPVNMGPGPAKYRQMRVEQGFQKYNLRVIVSGAATLDPRAEIFNHRFSPIIVLTTDRASPARLKRLRARGAHVKICGEKELDLTEALRWLRHQWGVRRLLCEGGGGVNDALFRAGLVDELYLTICPVLFGGATAPTLADGRGVDGLDGATRLQLKSTQRVRDEFYAVFQVSGPEPA